MRLSPIPPPYYTTDSKRRRVNKWLIIFIIGILLAGGALYYLLSRDPISKDTAKEEESILKDASEIDQAGNKEEEIKIQTVDSKDKEENSYEDTSEDDIKEYNLPSAYLKNTDSELLTEAFLKDTEIGQIKLIRDEIYARHGFVFKDRETQKYFEEKTWYVKNPNYTDELLNDVEKKNLDLIGKFLKDDNKKDEEKEENKDTEEGGQ